MQKSKRAFFDQKTLCPPSNKTGATHCSYQPFTAVSACSYYRGSTAPISPKRQPHPLAALNRHLLRCPPLTTAASIRMPKKNTPRRIANPLARNFARCRAKTPSDACLLWEDMFWRKPDSEAHPRSVCATLLDLRHSALRLLRYFTRDGSTNGASPASPLICSLLSYCGSVRPLPRTVFRTRGSSAAVKAGAGRRSAGREPLASFATSGTRSASRSRTFLSALPVSSRLTFNRGS